jgi:SAM-dependent methyltransferase
MASDAAFDPCASGEIAAYVRGLTGAGRPLVTLVHASDEMYRFELAAAGRSPDAAAVRYFSTARSIFRTVSEILAWRFGDPGQVRSLLDFASGYGRATRFLARVIDPARITAAEIDPGAVRFQEEIFGVRGCVSGTEPGDLPVPGPFDAVVAVSFFSHLPAARFEAWLARLYGLVGEGGVLAFSTHGPRLLPAAETIPRSGVAFRPESETTRLDGLEYGTSWVTGDFVRGAALRASAGAGRLSAFPFGLCGYQDLYVLGRPPLPGSPEPRLARDPFGALEFASVEGGAVAARGWAGGDRDERPPDVKLYFGTKLEALSSGHGAPGARRDWSFTFPASAVPPDRVVRIEAESARGVSRVLVAQTLRPYLP